MFSEPSFCVEACALLTEPAYNFKTVFDSAGQHLIMKGLHLTCEPGVVLCEPALCLLGPFLAP